LQAVVRRKAGEMTADKKPKVVAVVGPTAVGKSALVLQLAKSFGAEIVNADSVQIYRFLEIGAAKPTKSERRKVPHHLIDIVDPDEDFDALRYSQVAKQIVERLDKNGKRPLVVGGTGLYLKAAFHGLFPGAPCNQILRNRLRREAESDGGSNLYQRLNQVDPPTAKRVHPNDLVRIIRALEVWETCGKPLSTLQQEHGFRERPFLTLKIGLWRPRSELYERINNRVEAMMALGFLDEVKELLKRGYGPHLKSMQALGYRHLVRYLRDGVSLTETLRTLKRDTRRYAKRQMTWFRKDLEIHWFHPEEVQSITKLLEQFWPRAE
jgi:tRNA dimethylallyltransferase